jgi:steroid delta-isomerase-like uncharacterized protein
MAEQDLIAIARGVVEAFSAGDLERSVAPQANGLYNEVGTQRRLNGKDEILPALKGWRTAMPDVKGTVTKALASGNTVVLEITWEGTQTGPMETPGGTIPPSGKRQVTPSTWIFDFEGDSIKESRQYFDMVTFLSQIGAMPQQAS